MKKLISIFWICILVLLVGCSKDDDSPISISITIEDLSITIDENSDQGATLGTISANTNQGNIVFSLTNENPEGAMAIDSLTGVLTIANAGLFDYEVNSTLIATVVATNEDVTEDAIVTVKLNDIEPEEPITITIENFAVTIDENPVQGQSLGTIVASTNRGNITFSLTNENPQNAITIDGNTGVLTVADASLFEYDMHTTLTATMVAVNEDVTEEAILTVTLIEQPEEWRQIGADIDGKLAGDELGTSVSISADGSVVAIGASASNGYTGHVGVYRDQGGSWVQIGTDIIGEAAVDRSGTSVSLSADGMVVAIGANNNDGNGQTAGHVRIYRNQGNNWVQIGADIDGEARDNFSGQSVSLSADGSIVAIGAPSNSANGLYTGHVRVYQNQGGNWVKIGADIDGETIRDYAGYSVSLSADGSVVAIGSPRTNQFDGPTPGRVRVYRNQSGNWIKIGTDIIGQATADAFGYSVSLSADGSIVAIGAPLVGNNTGIGYAKVYRNMGSSWVQVGSDINGRFSRDKLGTSVSLNADGSAVAITASGYAVVHRNQGDSWVQTGSDITSGNATGISSDGLIVAVGDKNYSINSSRSGLVRVFKFE